MLRTNITYRSWNTTIVRATALAAAVVAFLAMYSACTDDSVLPVDPDPVSISIDEAPRWSPDGSHILYYHHGVVEVRNGYAVVDLDSIGLWVVGSDGSSPRILIRGINLSMVADWSPQSDSFAYSLGQQIYRAAFTGTGIDSLSIQQLTTIGWNTFPAWSPDGQWIAHDAESGPFKIGIMRADGTEKQVVEHTGMGDWRMPDWSPTGRICHIRYPPGTGATPEIFTMDRDGGNVVRVRFNQNEERFPQFSPNGLKIAYWTSYAAQPAEFGVWIVDADGGNPVRLAPGAAPSWSPDGEWIAFARASEQRGTIWKVRVDGSELLQVTFGPQFRTNTYVCGTLLRPTREY